MAAGAKIPAGKKQRLQGALDLKDADQYQYPVPNSQLLGSAAVSVSNQQTQLYAQATSRVYGAVAVYNVLFLLHLPAPTLTETVLGAVGPCNPHEDLEEAESSDGPPDCLAVQTPRSGRHTRENNHQTEEEHHSAHHK